MTVTELPKRDKIVPKLYEEDASKYAGPHRFQQSWMARKLRAQLKHYAYLRWAAPFTSIEVTGRNFLEDFEGPAIFVANHTSHLDTILTQTALPAEIADDLFYGAAQDRWFIKGRRKKELNPLYQSFVLGTFPIMRGGGIEALSYASELLTNGRKIFLFPEGTRSTNGELGAFKHGVSILALRHNVPVVPLCLAGLGAIRPKGSREEIPGPVSMDILPPMKFAQGTDVASTTDMLRTAMNEVYMQRHASVEDKPTRPESDRAA